MVYNPKMKKLAINKRARFDYDILEKFEGGLVLKGYEVKSIKNGRISIKNAFVTAKDEELFLTNANIPLYENAGKIENYEPTRPRKLLLHKKQLKYLAGRSQSEGLTMMPISVYNKERKIKLEFGLAKGRKKYDKRKRIKEREDKRRIERSLKS
jgi:SsrA-binding protein